MIIKNLKMLSQFWSKGPINNEGWYQMKKRLAVVLAATTLVVSLVVAGCGGTPTQPEENKSDEVAEVTDDESSVEELAEDETPKEEEPSEEEPVLERHNVGETVATDLVEFTLDDTSFAVALVNSVPSGNDITPEEDFYLLPKEYDPEEDAKNAFVASKGHTFVSIVFTANNLDRNSIDLDTYEGTAYDFVNVVYKGKTYTTFDFVKKSWWTLPKSHAGVSGTTVANTLIWTEGPEVHRGYIDLPFEPDSLDDSFDLIVTLPNSDGTLTSFMFTK